ncbi:MAG: hypothetical protein IIB54_13285 [Planctomycetes bacterium]|nr:hypothetical protein [Planctomycetota bacterium]
MPLHPRFIDDPSASRPSLNRLPFNHDDRYSHLGEALMWTVVLMALMILFIVFVWHYPHIETIGW